MTVQDAIIEVYEALGEPSNLDPYTSGTFDLAKSESQKILKWLNRGQHVVLNYKFPNGRRVSFRQNEGKVLFKSRVIELSVLAATSTTIQLDNSGDTLHAAADSATDMLNNWLIKVTDGTGEGQTRYIVDYDDSTWTATVSNAWDTTPTTASTVEVSKASQFFRASGDYDVDFNVPVDPRDIYTVLKITDINSRVPLSIVDRGENFPRSMVSRGRPGAYYIFNDRIEFDKAPDEERWYLIEYRKVANEVSAATDEFFVPPPWDEAIVLWAMQRGYRLAQESDDAYATKRDFEDFMLKTQEEAESRMDRENAYVHVDRSYSNG